MAQAGVVIGLAYSFRGSSLPESQTILQIILGAVVVFEILGPILLKFAGVWSGEVKLVSLLHHPETGRGFVWKDIIGRFLSSAGIRWWKKGKEPGEVLVKHIMRKTAEPLHEETPFNEILKYVEHSQLNHFPVADSEDRFVGMISYADIRDILFDQRLVRLLVARDLTDPAPVQLSPEATVEEALSKFDEGHVDALPVIDPAHPGHLVGILEQRDVLTAYHSTEEAGQEIEERR